MAFWGKKCNRHLKGRGVRDFGESTRPSTTPVLRPPPNTTAARYDRRSGLRQAGEVRDKKRSSVTAWAHFKSSTARTSKSTTSDKAGGTVLGSDA